MRSTVAAVTAASALMFIALDLVPSVAVGLALQSQTAKPAKTAQPTDQLDKLLAPIALYPDQLLAQMLLSAANPGKVGALAEWMASYTSVKGSELQDAATKAGFEASYVALVLFPDVINYMATNIDWTTKLGKAFTDNRSAVFDSIQRLRAQAKKAGTLKSTAQQDVETRTTSSGSEVIVIEPANPQVVYVPQYNPTVVYTQSTTSTVVVKEDDHSDAVAAGLIGFTAGIAIGAAVDNNYYYGPYGWHGGGYMYNDAWDDYYDAREDAREDWQDHREDMYEDHGDIAKNKQAQRTERTEARQENRPQSQAEREQRRTDAKSAAENRTTTTQSATQNRTANQESRGYSRSADQATSQRSGTKSDAFSGYSSGRSERSASQRGQRSRSSSRNGGSRRR